MPNGRKTEPTTPQRIIVDGMAWAEIVGVAQTDIAAIHTDMARRSARYNRAVVTRRSRGPVDFDPYPIERPTGITWYVRFFTKGYADFKRGGLWFTLYGLFRFNGHLWAVFTFGQPPYGFAFFSGHFFDRYRERYLLDVERGTADVVHEYFKHNAVGWTTGNPNGGIFVTTEQGAALGVVEDGVEIIKTFITPEQMYDEQQRAREQGLTIINEHTNNERQYK